MGWNHRILAHKYEDEVYYKIHEVYYDDKGKPNSYGKDGVNLMYHDLEAIRWTLNKIQECLSKPVLCAKNFPEEFKTE